jgi:hypothetical protein
MSQVMVFGTKSATVEEVERALIKEEVDELISRLSTDERRDLLESLRKRFARERDELRKVWGERE